MGTGRAKALLLNGSSGVGKSTALQELAMLLGARGIAHASIDLDELTLFWPRSADDPWGTRVAQVNLAAVSDTYRLVGVDFIAVAHVFTDHGHLNGCRAALLSGSQPMGDTQMPLVRLRASSDVIRERLIRRHATIAPWELEGFLADHESLARALDEANLDDVVIDVDDLSPQEVALRLADVAGW
jgi:hypothetical protein